MENLKDIDGSAVQCVENIGFVTDTNNNFVFHSCNKEQTVTTKLKITFIDDSFLETKNSLQITVSG